MAKEPALSPSLRDQFAEFFEDPSKDKLGALLRENDGESKNLDFKEAWPTMPALAKQILAMANSGGGCLVLGVKENEDGTFEPVGLPSFTDRKSRDIIPNFRSGARAGVADGPSRPHRRRRHPAHVTQRGKRLPPA
jgi:hypothetical protein